MSFHALHYHRRVFQSHSLPLLKLLTLRRQHSSPVNDVIHCPGIQFQHRATPSHAIYIRVTFRHSFVVSSIFISLIHSTSCHSSSSHSYRGLIVVSFIEGFESLNPFGFSQEGPINTQTHKLYRGNSKKNPGS